MSSMPIGRVFGWWAEREPAAAAVTCGSDVITRGELESRANRLARHWRRGGVGRDDLVSISLPNGVDFVVACAAAWKLGAIPQPLSPRLDGAERAGLLGSIAPALVVDSALPPVDGDDSPLPPAVARSWKAPTTSGSTGTPRLVLDRSPSTVDPEVAATPFLPRSATQLVAGPLFHSAPFTYAMRGLMTGHHLVVLPHFDATSALAAVERDRITWAMLVPTMMQRIWRSPERATTDVSSIEAVVHLGARCSAWLKRAWISWLGPERVVEVYAGTEAHGITMIRGDEWLERPGSVGRPLPGSSFRVVGAELQMRRDGDPTWHTQGDAGRIDDDGYVHVLDRLSDVIVAGGATVIPADVEGRLEQHPDVRCAVVVGRPDADLGHRVHAVVEADADVDREALLAWAADHLEPAARPRTLEVVAGPLRDDTGKVRRAAWR